MSIRNNYTQIYNFQEWTAKGKEQMTSAGIRYRFSEKSSLSANYGVFKNTNDLVVPQNYSVNQFMLLYQMNF
jgi:predicted porin